MKKTFQWRPSSWACSINSKLVYSSCEGLNWPNIRLKKSSTTASGLKKRRSYLVLSLIQILWSRFFFPLMIPASNSSWPLFHCFHSQWIWEWKFITLKRKGQDQQLEAMKAELWQMLSKFLIVHGVSAKYITSGSRPIVDDLLAGEHTSPPFLMG